MRLSFVVPVYNVHDYVIRCLTSLVNQNIPHGEYEIIVVIDGSPDDSLVLVTGFAKDYPNILIVDQENMGLSEARNQGFLRARGKYTWFIDSDDWITENCLRDLLNAMDDKQLDMFGVAPSIPAQTDFDSYYNSIESLSPVLSGKERLLNGQSVIGAWCYIFNSNFLRNNDLVFYKGIYFEDAEFIPRALFFAERVAMLTNFSVYFYFIRENSICNTFSRKHVMDTLTVIESHRNFLSIQKIEGELADVFNRGIESSLLSGLKMLSANKQENDSLLTDYLFRARELNLYPFRLKGGFSKRNVLLLLWNWFPRLTYKFYR